MEYPPNSQKSKNVSSGEKKLKRVTSDDPIRRKKGLGSQFRSTFLGGDAHSAFHYVVFGVLIPAAKDALAEAGAQGIERLIFGDSRARQKASRVNGPLGHINYNQRSNKPQPRSDSPRFMSRQARSQHQFEEIILTDRREAEEALERLFDCVDQFGSASVADLYELVGVKSAHTDNKWGWTDLRGADIVRVRNGYLLDLPETEPLD